MTTSRLAIQVAAWEQLRSPEGEQRYTVTVGTASSCEVRVIGDPYVSDRHAHVARDAEGLVHITDLCSTNGTYVNGVRVPLGASWRLRPGDVVRVGRTEIRW